MEKSCFNLSAKPMAGVGFSSLPLGSREVGAGFFTRLKN